jgi:hypothetical protein
MDAVSVVDNMLRAVSPDVLPSNTSMDCVGTSVPTLSRGDEFISVLEQVRHGACCVIRALLTIYLELYVYFSRYAYIIYDRQQLFLKSSITICHSATVYSCLSQIQ